MLSESSETKKKKKRVHTVLFNLYKVLKKNANCSIVEERRSTVTWEGGENSDVWEGRITVGHKENLEGSGNIY